MQQREQFLVAWISHEVSRTTLCQLFGISRQTGYKWVKRYKQESSLEERTAQKTSEPKVDRPAQRTKQGKRSTRRPTKRDTTSARKARRR